MCWCLELTLQLKYDSRAAGGVSLLPASVTAGGGHTCILAYDMDMGTDDGVQDYRRR